MYPPLGSLCWLDSPALIASLRGSPTLIYFLFRKKALYAVTAVTLIYYSDLISADAYLIQKIMVPLSLIGTCFFYY